ncbi:hypothetical protein [Chitinibacter tainanensis]|uniref:hypothetical protein n=1 Tax=Chitinibacter tainanensis TaxID=230667 RepID=UPI0004106379|nr:hypothetical protein [Chitinibacter tainanensis]
MKSHLVEIGRLLLISVVLILFSILPALATTIALYVLVSALGTGLHLTFLNDWLKTEWASAVLLIGAVVIVEIWQAIDRATDDIHPFERIATEIKLIKARF